MGYQTVGAIQKQNSSGQVNVKQRLVEAIDLFDTKLKGILEEGDLDREDKE